MFSAGEGAATLTVPAGVRHARWHTTTGVHARHRFVNRDAPSGASVVRFAPPETGKATDDRRACGGVPAAAAQGTIGVRVTTGGIRNCALFDAASVVRDEPGPSSRVAPARPSTATTRRARRTPALRRLGADVQRYVRGG